MPRILIFIYIILSTLGLSSAIAQSGPTTDPQQFVVVPSSGTGTYVGNAGLKAAITAANAATGPATVVIKAGSYSLDIGAPLPPLTKTDGLTIRGEGSAGVRIVIPCDPSIPDSINGRLFTLQGSYIDITNITVVMQPSCAAYKNVPFGIESGNDFSITDITLLNPTGFTVIGTSSTAPQRVTFRDIHGLNWKAAYGLSAINVVQAQSILFEDILFNAGDVCNSDTRSVQIKPVGLTDTIVMRRVSIFNSAICTGSPKPTTTAVTLDFSLGSIVNVWMDDCVFDATTLHGVEILSSGSNPTFAGNIRFRNCSFNAQAGGDSVFISLKDPNANMQTIEFDHNVMVSRNHAAIVLDSASTGIARALHFDGNDINTATTGWSGPGVAVSLGMDNFTFIGNHNTVADTGTPVTHPGSIFFQTTKAVQNGIIQGNFSSVASTTLDTSGGTITPSAVSGNIP